MFRFCNLPSYALVRVTVFVLSLLYLGSKAHQLNSGEGNNEKNNKKPFTRRLTDFFSQLENSCLPKIKHSRNQLELTNYFFLLWKRNIPYNMPKSDYITGVTSALLYFKATGKSDGNHFGGFGPFLWNTWIFSSKCPRTPEGNSTSLRNTRSVSSFFRIVSIQVRSYFVHRHTFYQKIKV